MKHTLVLLSTAAAAMLAVSSAQAKDLTGAFVNLGAGAARYHATVDGYDIGHDHDTAFILNAGYRTQFIGFEGGYTNLGGVKGRDGDLSAKLTGDGWTAGINGHFNPTKRWYISARGGAFVWKVHGKLISTDPADSYTLKASRQSMDWYAGVGTGVDINRNWSVGVHFDYYKIAKDQVDIGNRVFTARAEYRF